MKSIAALVMLLLGGAHAAGQVLLTRDQSPNELTFGEVETAIGPLIREDRAIGESEIRFMQRPYGSARGGMVRVVGVGSDIHAERFTWLSPRNGNVALRDWPPVGGSCSGSEYVCAIRTPLEQFRFPRAAIEKILAGEHPCPEERQDTTPATITVSSHAPVLWTKVRGPSEYREYACDPRPGTLARQLYDALVATPP
jgi:hypothetical protein